MWLRCAIISPRGTTLPLRNCRQHDARDLVVLTVGNAYLLVLADEEQVTSSQAQVDTSKVSLDQAVANHKPARRRCWTSYARAWITSRLNSS